MRETSVVRATRLLRALIDRTSAQRLPTIMALSKQFHVSWATMRSAMCLLRKEGVIEFGRGSAVTIVGRVSPPAPKRRTCAAVRLAEEIAEEISSGILRVGTFLPKQDFLCRTRHVSPRTVVKAYHQLVDDGFAYRRGNRYVVGPRPVSSSHSHSGRRPTIVILVPDRLAWEQLEGGLRSGIFLTSFMTEADRDGVALDILETESSAGLSEHQLYQKLISHVESLGPRYVGALMASGSRYARVLYKWGKRLVYLPPGLMYHTRLPVVPRFMQCVVNREAQYEAAVDFCLERGKTELFFPMEYYGSDYECSSVLDGLHGAAARHDGAVRIRGMMLHDWTDRRASERLLDKACENGSLLVRNSFEEFVRTRECHLKGLIDEWWPAACRDTVHSKYGGYVVYQRAWSLYHTKIHSVFGQDFKRVWLSLPIRDSLLQLHRPTIVTFDDYIADLFYDWAQVHARAVPEDIGIISLHGGYRPADRRITHVNTGEHTLGYRAYHWLRGDIPIKLDSRSALISTSTVYDQGSV